MFDKKLEIVARTIDDDQRAVADQWTDTFLSNPQDDIGTQMMKLVAACLAMGDFKIKPHLSKSNELQAPSDQLTVADYISHASRIILDYQNLSQENQQELLSYFPTSANTIISRSATHDVTRRNGQIVEGKGLILGIYGQLPSLLNTPRDFGVNIAMGGEGNHNFYGKKISSNGYSGHVYFHSNEAERLLMVGLEQSAPSSAYTLIVGDTVYPEDEQQHHDQFNQGHSLTGASDVYTAAGSLYFSDPIYQAKLMVEKGCFPPDKYGAMQVTLNDQNWSMIKAYLDGLKLNLREELNSLLLQKPTSAKPAVPDCKSYIALDFSQYITRIHQVFIEKSELSDEAKVAIHVKENLLLGHIKALLLGEFDRYKPFTTLHQEIINTQGLPLEYIHALNRIPSLFEKQLQIDDKLSARHHELLLTEQYESLSEDCARLLQKALDIRQYFISEHIGPDDEIEAFVRSLNKGIASLKNPHPHNYSLSESWIDCFIITPKMVSELETAITQCEKILEKTPKLISKAQLDELTQQLSEERRANQQLREELSRKDAVISRNDDDKHLLESDRNFIIQQRDREISEKVTLQLEFETYQQQRDAEQAQNQQLIVQQGQRVLARMTRIAPVIIHVNNLKLQAQALSLRGHREAYNQANNLIVNLERIIQAYTQDENLNENEALSSFKRGCGDELNTSRDILYQHRGFKQIVGNILMAVGTLGIGYVVAIAVNRCLTGNYTFFNNNTRTSKRIGEIRDSVDNLVAPSA